MGHISLKLIKTYTELVYYSYNNYAWIQISRQNWNGFFSNISHQIMI